MKNGEAAKMLTAKVECMERENSGTDLDCNYRNCDECKLCYAQGTMGEQIEALKVAITVLGAIDQYRCERDIAIEQLKELGYELGEKIRTDTDCVSRQAAIDAIKTSRYLVDAMEKIIRLPSAQPEPKWNRLMMHLADLQLTYSQNWGANGHGDEKLYDFVTGLIEELEKWE